MNARFSVSTFVILGLLFALMLVALGIEKRTALQPRETSKDSFAASDRGIAGILQPAQVEESTRYLLEASGALGSSVGAQANAEGLPAVVDVRFLDAATMNPLSRQWRFSGPTGNAFEAQSVDGVVSIPVGEWTVSDPAGRWAVWPRSIWAQPSAGNTLQLFAAAYVELQVMVLSDVGVPVRDAVVAIEDHTRLRPGDLAYEYHKTSASGLVRMARCPGPLTGFLLVSRSGYYPVQTTVPSEYYQGNQERPFVVTLCRLPSESKRYTIRLVNERQRLRSDCVVYAEPSGKWPDARPVWLGETDQDGLLVIDSWVLSLAESLRIEADSLRFRLSALEDLHQDGVNELIVPTALKGRIVLASSALGAFGRASISAIEQNMSRDQGQLIGLPLLEAREVDSSGAVPLALPAGRTYSIMATAWNHASAGLAVADGEDWVATLEALPAKSLTIKSNTPLDSAELRLSGGLDAPILFLDGRTEAAVGISGRLRSIRVRARNGASATAIPAESGECPGSLVLNFTELENSYLRVIDLGGRPVPDVELVLRREGKYTADGDWSIGYANVVRGMPDAGGILSISAPPGEYRVGVDQLPWRVQLPAMRGIEWPAGGVVELPGSQKIVVARPRRIQLSLEAARGAAPPWRWGVKTPDGSSACFAGTRAEFWVNTDIDRIAVLDQDEATLGFVDLYPGEGPQALVFRVD